VMRVSIEGRVGRLLQVLKRYRVQCAELLKRGCG
jgi:hypothetical protein